MMLVPAFVCAVTPEAAEALRTGRHGANQRSPLSHTLILTTTASLVSSGSARGRYSVATIANVLSYVVVVESSVTSVGRRRCRRWGLSFRLPHSIHNEQHLCTTMRPSLTQNYRAVTVVIALINILMIQIRYSRVAKAKTPPVPSLGMYCATRPPHI
jgi:hypothetical protein